MNQAPAQLAIGLHAQGKTYEDLVTMYADMVSNWDDKVQLSICFIHCLCSWQCSGQCSQQCSKYVIADYATCRASEGG